MRLPRVARLIKIISEIKTRPHQDLKALLSNLSISRAQFYKDRKALASLGFEFGYSQRSRMFQITADSYIPISELEISELFALVIAVRHLTTTGNYSVAYNALEGLKKILRGLSPPTKDYFKDAIGGISSRVPPSGNFSIIEELERATVEGRRVIITCRPHHEKLEREVTVDPANIFLKAWDLFLEGYCLEEKAFREYEISSIKKVEPTPILVPPQDKGLSVTRAKEGFSLFPDENPQVVSIRVSPKKAECARAFLHPNVKEVTNLPDGGKVFKLMVSRPRQVAWWALSWGADVEILEPADLRMWVEEEVKRLAELYIGKEARLV